MSDNFYDKIRNVTKNTLSKKDEFEEEITPEEDERIEYWVEDMVSHIEKRAASGRKTFSYDCSKIRRQIFLELSHRFKIRHSEFMVIRDEAKQHITVDWTGNNEV